MYNRDTVIPDNTYIIFIRGTVNDIFMELDAYDQAGRQEPMYRKSIHNLKLDIEKTEENSKQ